MEFRNVVMQRYATKKFDGKGFPTTRSRNWLK